jgi:hypothetical protein
MVLDNICGGRAVGMAAVVLVMVGGALMNDDSMSFVSVQAEVRA